MALTNEPFAVANAAAPVARENGAGAPAAVPDAAVTREQWLERLRDDSAANFHLHPDLVLSPDSATARPTLLVHRRPATDLSAAPDLIGVLAPKRVVFKPLSGVPLRLTLRGHRLVGNHVIGAATGDELSPFVDDLLRLITAGKTDCVLFEDVAAESPLYAAVTALRGARRGVQLVMPSPLQAHWWVEFPDNAEDYWEKFSKKSRYNIRSAAKKLEHRLVRCSAPQDVPEFLRKAHEVSLKSWQAKRLGVRVKNNPEERRHLEALARLGMLRSYLLEHEGRPVAFVLGMQWNGCFTYEEIGYDLAFSERSPGTVLLYRLLEDLIASDTPRRVDFGYGDADYKKIFGNRETQSGPLLLVRSALRPVATVWADRSGRAVTGWVRKGLEKSQVLTRIRQLYRK